MKTTTTTTGPWRQWRKRGRSQRLPEQSESQSNSVHLSTAVVVMLLAAVITGLNVNLSHGMYRACGPTANESGNLYGFPLPWLDVGGRVEYSDETRLMVIDAKQHVRIDWALALMNAAAVLGGLAAVAWLLERRIERKERRRRELLTHP